MACDVREPGFYIGLLSFQLLHPLFLTKGLFLLLSISGVRLSVQKSSSGEMVNMYRSDLSLSRILTDSRFFYVVTYTRSPSLPLHKATWRRRGVTIIQSHVKARSPLCGLVPFDNFPWSPNVSAFTAVCYDLVQTSARLSFPFLQHSLPSELTIYLLLHLEPS